MLRHADSTPRPRIALVVMGLLAPLLLVACSGESSDPGCPFGQVFDEELDHCVGTGSPEAQRTGP